MRFITNSYSVMLPKLIAEFYNTLIPRLPELRSYLIDQGQVTESNIELSLDQQMVVLRDGIGFYLSGSNTYCSFVQLDAWVKTLFVTDDFMREVNDCLVDSEYRLIQVEVSKKNSIGVPTSIELRITIDDEEPDEWMDEDYETSVLNLIMPVASKYSVGVSFPSYYYGQ